MNQNRDSRTGKFLPTNPEEKLLQRAEAASQLASNAIEAAAAGTPDASALVRRARRAGEKVLQELERVVQQ